MALPQPTPLAKKIAALNALRAASNPADVQRALRDALQDRSQRVVTKAAELCGELGTSDLVSELLEAYQGALVDPLKKDPGCLVKTAIVSSLVQLEFDDIEFYRRGIKYRQHEPIWGGRQDTAGQLRSVCAAGMVRCATAIEAITCFADLLADPCQPARLGAARAIAGLGSWEGVPLLRLKLLIGDEDAEVLGECCSALLHLAPADGVELVTRLLSSRDVDERLHAAFALGESHCHQALDALCQCWQTEGDSPTRRTLLTCIGLLRSTESQEFLLALVRGPDSRAGADALHALAPFRTDKELRQRVEQAVEESDHARVRDTFESEFEG